MWGSFDYTQISVYYSLFSDETGPNISVSPCHNSSLWVINEGNLNCSPHTRSFLPPKWWRMISKNKLKKYFSKVCFVQQSVVPQCARCPTRYWMVICLLQVCIQTQPASVMNLDSTQPLFFFSGKKLSVTPQQTFSALLWSLSKLQSIKLFA